MSYSNFRNINLIIAISIVAYIQLTVIHFSSANISISAEDSEFKKSQLNPILGKISKLVPFKKSKVSRVWKVDKNSINDNLLNKVTPEKLQNDYYVENYKKESPDFSTRLGVLQDEEGNKHEVKSTTWEDLSKSLGDVEIKKYLATLPLEVLRNVTSLARKNPQKGEKELVKLIMSRNTFKMNSSPGVGVKNNVQKVEPSAQDTHLGSDGKFQLHVYGYQNTLPSITSQTNNKASSEFELPIYQDHLPQPNPYPNHYENAIDSPVYFPKSQIKTTGMVLTNSGYFLPELTTPQPQNLDPFNTETQMYENKDYENINFDSHNPINTFKPNVDKFLNPPEDFAQSQSIRDSIHYSDELSEASSSVWIATPQSQFEEKNNPSSHSSIKLVPAASSPNNNVAFNDGYNYYDHENSKIEQKPFSEFQHYQQTPNLNYDHSTAHYEAPVSSHTVSIDTTGIHFNNEQKNNPIQNPQLDHSIQSHHHRPPSQHLSQNAAPVNSEQPPSIPQESPGSGWNPGWGPYPISNYGPGNSDWGPSEIWNSLKTYFKKGGKTTAEKVFEISIVILSFLAFGGYLLMLIYQVFAVSSTVPLFPLFSPAVPQNPTLFGLIFGRSANADGSFRFIPNVEFDDVKYIEELEEIVKTAMDKVKRDWVSMKNETSKLT